MPAPRLLVFDLDGTLIDSSLDLCNSINAALAHMDQGGLPNEVIASYIGDGAAMLVRRSLTHPQIRKRSPEETAGGRTKADVDALLPGEDDELFRRTFDFFLTYYRAHKLDHTRCYPGVIDALTEIRAAHPRLPMAVLTNKPVNPSREICVALGLSPFFFQNYGGNSFATKKPDPEGLLMVIAEASSLLAGEDRSAAAITPEETVMIGDSDVDVLTARACGARSLGCSFGLAPEALAAAHPNASVDAPSGWKAALGL